MKIHDVMTKTCWLLNRSHGNRQETAAHHDRQSEREGTCGDGEEAGVGLGLKACWKLAKADGASGVRWSAELAWLVLVPRSSLTKTGGLGSRLLPAAMMPDRGDSGIGVKQCASGRGDGM